MQKISSYLYSNRIVINLDLASSPVEWRIVYQRNVKLYKGYDNIIELDIKNAEQRRFNVSALTLKCLTSDNGSQQYKNISEINSKIKFKSIKQGDGLIFYKNKHSIFLLS